MRERVEDLGKIAVHLDRILDLEIWDLKNNVSIRNKDFVEIFSRLEEEAKDQFLHSLVYGLEELKERLYECREIAYGEEDD